VKNLVIIYTRVKQVVPTRIVQGISPPPPDN
jgi:hypothetical protein